MTIWRRHETPLVVGHRGGRGEGFPIENTVAAFEVARKQGARAIELDVQASADGEAIVVHDPDLARITADDDPRRVADLELAELRAVALPGGARLSSLGDVFDWAESNDIAVNVEVKRDGANRAALVMRVARLVRHARVDVLLSSFDPFLLSAIGALAPRVPRAWLVHPKESPPFDVMAFAARRPIVHAVHPSREQLTEARVRTLRSHGMLVGAYTVNDHEEAQRLAKLGVDWVITDRPDEAMQWFAG